MNAGRLRRELWRIGKRVCRRRWRAPSRSLRFGRLLHDGMPRVATGAAVTPRHYSWAAQHLLDGHVMIRPALGTAMRNACLFRLTRGQRTEVLSILTFYFHFLLLLYFTGFLVFSCRQDLEANTFGDEDRRYNGSRFADVVDALFANPYQRVWGGEGEPPLPVGRCTCEPCSGRSCRSGRTNSSEASERTLDSRADLRWGPDRKGFAASCTQTACA